MQRAEYSSCKVSECRIVLSPDPTWPLLCRSCLLRTVSFIFSRQQFVHPLAGTLEKLRTPVIVRLTLSKSREDGCPFRLLSGLLKLVLGAVPSVSSSFCVYFTDRKGVIALKKCGNKSYLLSAIRHGIPVITFQFLSYQACKSPKALGFSSVDRLDWGWGWGWRRTGIGWGPGPFSSNLSHPPRRATSL